MHFKLLIACVADFSTLGFWSYFHCFPCPEGSCFLLPCQHLAYSGRFSAFSAIPIQNYDRGEQMAGHGRSAVGWGPPLDRMQSDLESQIHLLAREAYFSVLRAFRAQAEALSWDKASLICDLRKELNVSDDEHRELLSMVNTNDTLCRIREWREAGGAESAVINNMYPAQDPHQSLSVSTFHKKQKTEPAFGSSMQPTSSAAKLDLSPRTRQRKTRKGLAFPAGCDPGKVVSTDPLVGKKVMIRWPADNNFYEAVITDYNPSEGMHAVVYDINTPNETWEWVNLTEIPPDDIRLGRYPGFALRPGRRGSGRGTKVTRRRGRLSGSGRGRRVPKDLATKNDFPQQNGAFGGLSGEITILNTDNLIEEVEKIFSSGNWDRYAVEKAKQALLDHEQSLVNVLSRLADASDGESDGSDHQLGQHEQSDGDEDQMIEI